MGLIMLAPSQAASTISAAADFAARSAGAVWAHNFATEDEVDAWRFTNQGGQGFDPNSVQSNSGLVRWEAGEGIVPGTGILRCESLSTGETPVYWWRNFDPELTSGSTTESFVVEPGTAMYLQVRCRMNAARLSNFGTNANGLKIFELNTAQSTFLNQGCHIGRTGGRPYVQVLNTASGGTHPWPYVDIGGNNFKMQPGGAQDATCLFQNEPSFTGCRLIPADEWVTYHMKMIAGTADTADTVVELKIADAGETSYANYYSRTDNWITGPFADSGGHSAVAVWNRDENSTGLVSGCYHDIAEIIFSLSPIACPAL